MAATQAHTGVVGFACGCAMPKVHIDSQTSLFHAGKVTVGLFVLCWCRWKFLSKHDSSLTRTHLVCGLLANIHLWDFKITSGHHASLTWTHQVCGLLPNTHHLDWDLDIKIASGHYSSLTWTRQVCRTLQVSRLVRSILTWTDQVCRLVPSNVDLVLEKSVNQVHLMK